MPVTTLRAWTRGQDYVTQAGSHREFEPLIDLADSDRKLLSFYNLVEAHVLRSTTERGVPLQNVRKALQYIREKLPGTHPLLEQDFEISGKDIFIQHLGSTITATRQGQLAMRKILEKHLQRIARDRSGLPMRIFPINSKRLFIDPRFSSGKPVVKESGIVASVLWGRQNTGESLSEIAKDYGLTTLEVKEAIQEYAWKSAA